MALPSNTLYIEVVCWNFTSAIYIESLVRVGVGLTYKRAPEKGRQDQNWPCPHYTIK